jgi:hypothetical protein
VKPEEKADALEDELAGKNCIGGDGHNGDHGSKWDCSPCAHVAIAAAIRAAVEEERMRVVDALHDAAGWCDAANHDGAFICTDCVCVEQVVGSSEVRPVSAESADSPGVPGVAPAAVPADQGSRPDFAAPIVPVEFGDIEPGPDE